MLSTRFISFFLFFLTFGVLTYAAPASNAALAKRQDTTDITTVFNNLKSSTDTILPQIDALVSGGTASDDTVTPLINQLTDALNTATTSLNNIPASDLQKRDAIHDIAALIALIIRDITETLDGVLLLGALEVPALTGLLVEVDIALNKVLVAVEFLLAGVLVIVSALLVDIAILLKDLGFTLTVLLLKL